jgi:UDP-3-O-[3-hydroxymyristoyl] glucosamine N-acyltransferase
MFGGQVGLAGHITVGDHVNLGGQSGIHGSLKSNQTLIGSPAIEPTNFFKSSAIFRKLPDLYKEIYTLRKELDELKKKD